MDNVLVAVHEGHLRGVIEKNVNGVKFMAFRGVPFAKPPVGPLRFKDPEPMSTWGGVRNASKFGNPCAQRNWVTCEIIGTDDCLYLNIYTTMLKPTLPRAVMVWIYGGSFVSGSSDDYFFGPDYLIEKDVVLVTINYRVGILGFINIDDEEAPGNQGLKDQVMALKWVQQNIAQFGGDPNNVTIFGHSAGAASVHYLAISPLAQGLFHRAILQSGVASHPWATTPIPNPKSIEILASLLHEDISDKISFVNYLRTIDAHQLVKMEVQILKHLDHSMNTYPFVPSIDSKAKNPFLTIPIEEAAKVGIKVPCIIGYLAHEGLVFVGAMKNKLYDKRNPNNILLHPYTSRFFEQYHLTASDVKHFFFGEQKISSCSLETIRDVISGLFFDSNIHNVIEIQSKILDIPTYFYKFEYELEMSVNKKILGINMKGTCHGDEIGFLFHSKLGTTRNEELPVPNAVEHRLMQKLTEMWTNFAKIGNPTPQITELLPITWEPIDDDVNFKCLKINREIRNDIVKNINRQLIESKRQ